VRSLARGRVLRAGEKGSDEAMGTMISNGTDVVAFLKDQHVEIKALFGRVTAAKGEQRKAEFGALRRLLAVHETAEEEIVHPAARRLLPDGDAVVSARLREEKEAKQVLTELEKLDPDSTEFTTKFVGLQKSVVAHATAEEHEEFARLGSQLKPEQLERMRKAVEFAEAVAPTRPHAGIESSLGNLLVGPFASMIDRTRDAFSRK
jgi:hemerythrin superfamily protein